MRISRVKGIVYTASIPDFRQILFKVVDYKQAINHRSLKFGPHILYSLKTMMSLRSNDQE